MFRNDFGYWTAINHGIIDFNYDGEHARYRTCRPISDRKQKFSGGRTFGLTCMQPVRNDVFSLTNDSGNFKSKEEVFLLKDIDIEEIQKEWLAQIEKFIWFGAISF